MKHRGTHATDPMRLTNLSRSFAPSQAVNMARITTRKRKRFFSILVRRLYLPLRRKRPNSKMERAGNN